MIFYSCPLPQLLQCPEPSPHTAFMSSLACPMDVSLALPQFSVTPATFSPLCVPKISQSPHPQNYTQLPQFTVSCRLLPGHLSSIWSQVFTNSRLTKLFIVFSGLSSYGLHSPDSTFPSCRGGVQDSSSVEKTCCRGNWLCPPLCHQACRHICSCGHLWSPVSTIFSFIIAHYTIIPALMGDSVFLRAG